MIRLPYGHGEVSCSLPGHIPHDVISYREEPKTPGDPIEEALLHPIGGKRLRDLAAGKSTAVILISDGSRLCPSYRFLTRLLHELNDGGIPDSRIQIIAALGMHRRHTEEELAELAGQEAAGRVPVLNHSSLAEDCVRVGVTSRGTPVEINRNVVEADLRIATGNIEPHRLAGMSGGIKAVIPGCASAACIEANHALSRIQKVVPGRLENPVHEDLEEAQQLVPVHFLLNVVVNHRKEIMAAAAGDPIPAHRSLLKTAAEHFLIDIPDRYDVVIASPGGYPKDTQLYQAVKTLQNADAFAKPGGAILLAAECREQFGNGVFQQWVETMPDRETMVRHLQDKFVLGAHKILPIDEILSRLRVYFYSSMPPSLVELLGFQPVTDLQEGLSEVLGRVGNTPPKVAVMPYGALTFLKKG